MVNFGNRVIFASSDSTQRRVHIGGFFVEALEHDLGVVAVPPALLPKGHSYVLC